MTDSILNTVKKILGLPDNYTVFDTDVLIHINTVFSTLQQLGVGPNSGFSIADATDTWEDYLGSDPRLNSVKTYVSLRVRMLFDPPQTSYLINALNEQIKEFEWRLNVHMEETIWVDPDPNPIPDEETV